MSVCACRPCACRPFTHMTYHSVHASTELGRGWLSTALTWCPSRHFELGTVRPYWRVQRAACVYSFSPPAVRSLPIVGPRWSCTCRCDRTCRDYSEPKHFIDHLQSVAVHGAVCGVVQCSNTQTSNRRARESSSQELAYCMPYTALYVYPVDSSRVSDNECHCLGCGRAFIE